MKTLGQICCQGFGNTWNPSFSDVYERAAAAVIAEHERRKPVPGDVAGLVKRLRTCSHSVAHEAADALCRQHPAMDAKTVAKGRGIIHNIRRGSMEWRDCEMKRCVTDSADFIESLLPKVKTAGQIQRDRFAEIAKRENFICDCPLWEESSKEHRAAWEAYAATLKGET
jgi:hypothetical protein